LHNSGFSLYCHRFFWQAGKDSAFLGSFLPEILQGKPVLFILQHD